MISMMNFQRSRALRAALLAQVVLFLSLGLVLVGTAAAQERAVYQLGGTSGFSVSTLR